MKLLLAWQKLCLNLTSMKTEYLPSFLKDLKALKSSQSIELMGKVGGMGLLINVRVSQPRSRSTSLG